MFKKLLFVLLAALFLGGCNLDLRALMGEAATDVKSEPSPIATSTPAPAADPDLEKIPPSGTGTDNAALESDINATVILDEDFSDLE